MIYMVKRDVTKQNENESCSGLQKELNAEVLLQLDTAETCLSLASDQVVCDYAREWTSPYIKRIDAKDATLFDEVASILKAVTTDEVNPNALCTDVIEIMASVWARLETPTKHSLLTRLYVVGLLIRPDASSRT